ncbi:type 1 glutamine amidotransferase [Arenibacter certesii]|uniref:Glutamine amidotransferase domain-containing protein n=1 Tax=Arenibacter certesii TaxID=228955 RepID=A0A918MIT6_9FLAO|nr:type 1 glutamine amidotransferase [Arenibacter certesii]GGW28987.1 hypothetical protein GCM10007383_12990 [Arenibacter certesii]
MRLLIVEGNNENTRSQREAYGIMPYHLKFQEMLRGLVPKAQTDFAFPADVAIDLPTTSKLEQYDGVLWTGSSLSVLDNIPDVQRQLNFADDVFKSGIPFYGSCWGMQIATVVAGGKVVRSKNGLEFGVSKPIEVTPLGKISPFLSHRIAPYSALCVHYDEVDEVPHNALVLASNSHSKVQAMTFDFKKGSFFGVQYHPEFNTSEMALIASFLSQKLVGSKVFDSLEDVQEFCLLLREQNGIPFEISDYQLHTQEIMAWLKQLSA